MLKYSKCFPFLNLPGIRCFTFRSCFHFQWKQKVFCCCWSSCGLQEHDYICMGCTGRISEGSSWASPPSPVSSNTQHNPHLLLQPPLWTMQSVGAAAPGFILIPLGDLLRVVVTSIHLSDLCNFCRSFEKKKITLQSILMIPCASYTLKLLQLSQVIILDNITVKNLTLQLKSHLFACVPHFRTYLCAFSESQNYKWG